MLKDQKIHKIEDIEFKVIYSRRRSIGISVLPDSSVIVRVPNLTPFKTISRIVTEKYDWIVKHRDNYKQLSKSGISKIRAKIFLPPYEWYNDSIARWTTSAGVKLVDNSSGTITSQDWTFPEKGKPYFSSDTLMKNLVSYEKRKGLNGYILLIHPGTDPRRKDKFYLRLDSILNWLETRKYSFHSFSEIN